MSAEAAGDPDAVLLVNRERERREQLAGFVERIFALVLAQHFAPGPGRPWGNSPAAYRAPGYRRPA